MQPVFLTQQTINSVDDDFILTWIEVFLLERRSRGLCKGSVKYYAEKLGLFTKFCDSQVITRISQLTPSNIRDYLLALELAGHNPGGIHSAFRSLRAFLYWWEAEVEPAGRKNPIRKVRAPKVPLEPLEPVEISEIARLLDVCDAQEFTGLRDKAIFLALLDTGARANEFLQIDLKDVDLITGSILIRMGKGRKPRMVYLGKRTRKAIRAYLRARSDRCPALWINRQSERLLYGGLKEILIRRAKQAGFDKLPTLHSFRRAFALNFLRNNPGDIYSLQRLMGHAYLTVLRRYLAQTEGDIQEAYQRSSPVDHADW